MIACLALGAAASGAAIALVRSGGSASATRVGQVAFQPCLTFSVEALGEGRVDRDDGYRPTAREALNAAIAGRPTYLFTGAHQAPAPPSGVWQVDAPHSKAHEIHVTPMGTVDWVALVGYGYQSGYNMPAERGWQYEVGSPWPSRYKQVPC